MECSLCFQSSVDTSHKAKEARKKVILVCFVVSEKSHS